MAKPICPYDTYCYRVSEEHWRKYAHPGRTSRTKIRLFHGTRTENIYATGGGIKPSPDGRLGPGIYLTIRSVALKIAYTRGHGYRAHLLEYEVDVGKMKTCKDTETDTTWSSMGYDSCKSMHPAWIVGYDFPEWCVKDASQLKFLAWEPFG